MEREKQRNNQAATYGYLVICIYRTRGQLELVVVVFFFAGGGVA